MLRIFEIFVCYCAIATCCLVAMTRCLEFFFGDRGYAQRGSLLMLREPSVFCRLFTCHRNGALTVITTTFVVRRDGFQQLPAAAHHPKPVLRNEKDRWKKKVAERNYPALLRTVGMPRLNVDLVLKLCHWTLGYRGPAFGPLATCFSTSTHPKCMCVSLPPTSVRPILPDSAL